MKVTAIVLCAASLCAFSLSPREKTNKKAAKSFHSDRVFLDVDRIGDDKLWVRVNNDSDVEIYVRGLPSPSKCEDYPEYYFDRVVQRRYSEENRKAMEASNPSLIGKNRRGNREYTSLVSENRYDPGGTRDELVRRICACLRNFRTETKS
jgi:hypothetical protein